MINSIEIDKLTPCLERLKGNEIVNTSYIFANESELSGLKNWLFNWNDTDLKDCRIVRFLNCQLREMNEFRDLSLCIL